jgi:hypothetical protein
MGNSALRMSKRFLAVSSKDSPGPESIAEKRLKKRVHGGD